MKHIPLFTFTFTFCLHLSLLAAVPLRWTVETSRAQPAQFEAYQGETLTLEASLQSYGKPLELSGLASLYWQTNGMGSAYWEATAAVNSNRLSAVFTPEMDVGAKVYNCFIGVPGTIYHAAFQLRLRPSPGATPNVLPLPTPVIDFAKVRVLNPPWESGGGVNTNAVIDIIHETVSGSARSLPKYLHERYFDDSYPDEAKEYYRSRGNGKTDGGCSAVRDGGFLYRNFDYPFDDRAEFVVRMSAGPNRFASVGVSQVGTNLTEAIVTSGKPSRCYKWLPGATVDGINEHGVVAEINVVDTPVTGWHTTGDLHPLGAIRWILDHATNAQSAAEYIAANIRFPQGWAQNFHYMVADATSTYIVENGTAYPMLGRPVMTNFRLYPTHSTGAGQERYDLLLSSACCITNAWYTRAYLRSTNWISEFKDAEEMEVAKSAWETYSRERLRGHGLWQSVHTSVYDITNRVLRVAVQEVDDWYTFAVPSCGAVKSVNGKTGEVVLDAADVGAMPDTFEETDPTATAKANAAIAAAGLDMAVKTNEYGCASVGNLYSDYGVSAYGDSNSVRTDYNGSYFWANNKRWCLPWDGEYGSADPEYKFAMHSDLSCFVPYTGAHRDIDLDRYSISSYGFAYFYAFNANGTDYQADSIYPSSGQYWFPWADNYGVDPTHDFALVSQVEAASEFEDTVSNVVWKLEAEGGRFFFKPVRPINMED